MANLRIPFAAAIEEKLLLKARFKELSTHQQVVLKVLYGCELTTIKDDKGFSELDYWYAGQGFGIYDELGYLTGIMPDPTPYVAKEYEEAWIIAGRRAGKSDALMSTIVAYEATCGGHEEYIRRGQQAHCFQIAQDMRMARNSLHFIKATIESSTVLKKLIKNITADSIELTNGLNVTVTPPTVKSTRGYANPVAVCDEIGVWYQDVDSANPDMEVYRATKPGQTQFEFPKLVGISSPWNKGGLLYQYYTAGTDGKDAPKSERDRFSNCLVWRATTASLGNPRIKKSWLVAEKDRDPRAFEREYLAVFQDSISGFLSPSLLKDAVEAGVVERPPDTLSHYVAAMDPAFKRDAFGFAICHATTSNEIVFDLMRRYVGTVDQPLNPLDILKEIADICRKYKIAVVYSDQYHMETLQQLSLQLGFSIQGIPFTATNKAAIYGNLQQLLNQRRLKLLDDHETLKELRQIEREVAPGGNVQISAPRGQHDDMATVVALAADNAIWMLPDKPAAPKPPPKTPFEIIMDQRKRERRLLEFAD